MTEPLSQRAAGWYRTEQRVLYETACALAESSTLADAAPRMLEAICEALDWEYGALWRVDRAAARAALRRDVARSSVALRRVCRRQLRQHFATGIGLPGRVWASRRAGLDSRRGPRREFSARRFCRSVSDCTRRFGFPCSAVPKRSA